MAIPFIDPSDEDGSSRKLALIAIATITFSLTLYNVTGAIAGSSGEGLLWVPRVAFALVISGAEILAAVALVRVMLAPNRLRKIVGAAIFLGLTWVDVQNGKKTSGLLYPDMFAEDAQALDEKAQLADTTGNTAAGVADTALKAGPERIKDVQKQIADLQLEQRKMSAQSPEGIKEAQALLLAQGKYFGTVDGIRADKTEAAMRGRGEEISAELSSLKIEETNLRAGAALPVQTAAATQKTEAIATRAKARKAREGGVWIEVMLWVVELARGFGLWALVAQATAGQNNRLRNLADEIEAARLEAELAKVRGAAPPPAEPKPEPAPQPIPEPIAAKEPEPDLTDAERRSRAGGLAMQQQARADKAAGEDFVLVGDWSARDAAMKLAAE